MWPAAEGYLETGSVFPVKCGNSFFIQRVRDVELEWVQTFPDKTGNKGKFVLKKKKKRFFNEIRNDGDERGNKK